MSVNRFAKQLSVVANPWHHLDHIGRPVGIVPWHPDHNPGRGWVGAHLCPEQTRITVARDKGDIRSPVQITVFNHSPKPVAVPALGPQGEHYKRAIRDGALIAADKLTAALAGVKYRDPAEVLAEAEEKAVAKFDEMYGDGAWQTLAADREAEKPVKAEVA